MEKVRDGADAMPRAQLEQTLAAELGDGWRDQLVHFEEAPVAAASIGQVHRGTLADGRQVAMKVQYPGVAESIRSDLWSMKQLMTYTGLVPRGLRQLRRLGHRLRGGGTLAHGALGLVPHRLDRPLALLQL